MARIPSFICVILTIFHLINSSLYNLEYNLVKERRSSNEKIVLITCFAIASLLNAESMHYSDSVNVINSEPIYKTIITRTPYQECWDEEVTSSSGGSDSPLGALIGGVAGGILGHQVGGGSGKLRQLSVVLL